MAKTLHEGDSIDSLYVSRNEGVRGLTSFEDCVDASRQDLEDYIKKAKKTTYNPQKSPRDVRRLAIIQTPEKDHQLTMVRKTHKERNTNR